MGILRTGCSFFALEKRQKIMGDIRYFYGEQGRDY